MTIELTEETFDEFLKSSQLPVFVDFWAPWCGPCRLVSPTIEYLSQQEDRLVNFAKVDVQEFPEMSRKYDFVTIPTFILFKNGELVTKIKPNGFSAASIVESIRTALAERGL
jgi:thioredoxin 1